MAAGKVASPKRWNGRVPNGDVEAKLAAGYDDNTTTTMLKQLEYQCLISSGRKAENTMRKRDAKCTKVSVK
jgi:hypothetical protein